MLLKQHILPDLGEHRVHTITPIMVRNRHAAWYADVPGHAYSLLKTIKNTTRGRSGGRGKADHRSADRGDAGGRDWLGNAWSC